MLISLYTNNPPSQISLQNVIPSYLYSEYYDDDNLQGFIAAYNAYVQLYINWFNTIGLPVYTGEQISGPLLDWVIEGIYGLGRPTLPAGTSESVGPYNTFTFNTVPINSFQQAGPPVVYATTDDIYKRILTWHFFKGDGKAFTIPWLKRRIMRFLFGVGGTNYIIDQTYPVSVSFSGSQVNITITNADPVLGPILKTAILSGAVELPFQYSYSVTLQ